MKMKSEKAQKSSAKRVAASDDIPDELPVRSLKRMTEHRSWALYGRSGTGKTTLSMTFPGKKLLLDVQDKGTDSVSDLSPKEAVGMEIKTWDDFEMVYYYLLKKKGDGYGSVVIDTVTQVQNLALIKVLEDKKKSTSRAGDWGTMTKRDWGDVAALMKEWIINYRDLTEFMEVVFIAQDRVFNLGDDESDSEVMLEPEVGPRLSPSIAAHLNAAVNVIGNTFIKMKTVTKEVGGKKKEVQKSVYCLRIAPHDRYVTKARKPKSIRIPDVIEDPDYEEIDLILQGE